VAFVCWLAALGKIFTKDNLRKWRVIVVNWCCMCKRNGSLWTIFCFIVKLPVSFGMFSSIDLGCLRLCIDE
jgi:hypothetical protein